MTTTSILPINAGSSSIKFAPFPLDQPLVRAHSGRSERIGLPDGVIVTDHALDSMTRLTIHPPTHSAYLAPLMDWVRHHARAADLQAVGYRVVHGGSRYSQPERITPEVMDELCRISSYDPEHMPTEIGLIEAFQHHHPRVPQVACFDTAFHRTSPRVSRILPIPHRYDEAGVQRYGFHGLSYASIWWKNWLGSADARKRRGA